MTDPFRDAFREATRMDNADDYDQDKTPSVGCILEYETYGGGKRLVRVTEVEECDPEKGRPTFSALIIAEEIRQFDKHKFVWGYWSQIVRIVSRGDEVVA